MRLLPRTAAYRIGIASAAAFAVATALIGAAVFFAVHAAFVRQLDETVAQAQVSLLSEYHDDGVDGLVEAIATRESRPSSVLGFALFDASGRKVAGRLQTDPPKSGWSRITFRDPVEGSDPARALTTGLANGYRLVVAADLESVERMDDTILAVFGLAFAAILAIGALFAFGLGRYLKRRLDAIAKGARAFTAGNLTGRAEVGTRGDEFDQLAHSLNTMLERIEALMLNLRQVTSDLAHDLRTPLTRLRNDLERLRSVPPEEAPARIDRAVERCDDILRLFSAILRISELEEGNAQRSFTPLDLNDLVSDLAEAHEPLAEEQGIQLRTQFSPSPLVVSGDRDLLAQALVNLIENALRHSPVGGTITVGAIADDGYPALYVRDAGPGIAPEDRSRVTERFVRLEEARSSPGYGLGLALVQAIARAHSGELRLGDASPGLDARIIFLKDQ